MALELVRIRIKFGDIKKRNTTKLNIIFIG